jgi:hypothetical protein
VNPIQRVIREGVVVGLANHTLLIRPDGTEVPIHDSAAPILDDTQRLKGVVLVFRARSKHRRKRVERSRPLTSSSRLIRCPQLLSSELR